MLSLQNVIGFALLVVCFWAAVLIVFLLQVLFRAIVYIQGDAEDCGDYGSEEEGVDDAFIEAVEEAAKEARWRMSQGAR